MRASCEVANVLIRRPPAVGSINDEGRDRKVEWLEASCRQVVGEGRGSISIEVRWMSASLVVPLSISPQHNIWRSRALDETGITARDEWPKLWLRHASAEVTLDDDSGRCFQ